MGVLNCWIFFSVLLILTSCWCQQLDYPSANLGSTWINNDLLHTMHYIDGSSARPLLTTTNDRLKCAFGFFHTSSGYFLCIFILEAHASPQVIWTANKNKPVGENATLELASDGDLLLNNSNGTLVWSTNTSKKGVTQISIQEAGIVMLLDGQKRAIWQSCEHAMGYEAEYIVDDYIEMEKDGLIQMVPSSSPAHAPLPPPGSPNPFVNARRSPFAGYAIIAIVSSILGSLATIGLPGLPTRFTYKAICLATHKFSTKLGEGGFGSVYLGTLQDGTQVAVKQLEGSKQGQKEFKNEITGFLVTMQNMSWGTRMKIATGTARGLSYLHEECRETIIHLDIKPQNILLDENFNAKVADFGLSKLTNRDQREMMTQMRGTPGYMAPEWLHFTITSKTDVYSYGVLLLEIISGRKSLDLSCCDHEKVYFPKWASQKLKGGLIMDLVDPRLSGMFNKDEVLRATRVAFWCIQDDPEVRPTMTNVLKMFDGTMETSTPPLDFLHPSFPKFNKGSEHGSSQVLESIPLASELSGPR